MFADEENASDNKADFIFNVNDLQIIASASDMKTMLTTAPDLLDEEEELKKIASSSKSGAHSME
eukprot:13898933-Ditylum_brightwellii.AAC.1